MSIKNKVFAVSMAAAISVTGFLSVMSVKADYAQEPCIECGEDAIFYEVVDTKWEYTGTTRLCEHGYEKESDIEINHWKQYRYYCADCDIHWEKWFFWGTTWYCTHDNVGHNP